MQIRRVVTGQLANGTSVFVSDDVIADDQFGQLWGSDDAVALPTDGAEVKLTVGDCVIQNGTRHAWHNRGDEPATVASALVGAPRRQ